MFETVMAEFGRLDIAVSNAGIEHFGDLTQDTGEDVDRVFAVNVKGQYFVAQQAYRYMGDFGRVMLTSSISAVKVSTVVYFLLPLSQSHPCLCAEIVFRVYHATQSTLHPKQPCRA